MWLHVLYEKFGLDIEDPIDNPELWTLRTPFPVQPSKVNCFSYFPPRWSPDYLPQLLQFPYQVNDYDCGLFVIKYAEHLVSGRTINHDARAPRSYLAPGWPGWPNMDHLRLRLWIDLPKGHDDRPFVPSILRNDVSLKYPYLHTGAD